MGAGNPEGFPHLSKQEVSRARLAVSGERTPVALQTHQGSGNLLQLHGGQPDTACWRFSSLQHAHRVKLWS
jgi:hypothetical protein